MGFLVSLNTPNPLPFAANLDVANLDTNFTKPLMESLAAPGARFCSQLGATNVDAVKESCDSDNLDSVEGVVSCYSEFLECTSQLSDKAKMIYDKLEELFPGMGSYPNEGEYTMTS